MRNEQNNPLFELLFPTDAVCFACNRPAIVNEQGLCVACAPRVLLAGHRPPGAGLDGLVADHIYAPALHPAMHRFKYGGERYLARYFAAAIALPAEWLTAVPVAVPLHPRRQKERGFNQSDYLVRALRLRYPLPKQEALLTRRKETAAQAQLTAEQRAQNIQGAFVAAPSARGKAILLVDDVATTGSTLRACALALREQGAATVFAACACIAE